MTTEVSETQSKSLAEPTWIQVLNLVEETAKFRDREITDTFRQFMVLAEDRGIPSPTIAWAGSIDGTPEGFRVHIAIDGNVYMVIRPHRFYVGLLITGRNTVASVKTFQTSTWTEAALEIKRLLGHPDDYTTDWV